MCRGNDHPSRSYKASDGGYVLRTMIVCCSGLCANCVPVFLCEAVLHGKPRCNSMMGRALALEGRRRRGIGSSVREALVQFDAILEECVSGMTLRFLHLSVRLHDIIQCYGDFFVLKFAQIVIGGLK